MTMPNKANLHAARVALWRMVQFIVRESHRVHFKKGYSGSDITEQQVFTTAIFLELIGHPARAGTVARRIDLPRERRHAATCAAWSSASCSSATACTTSLPASSATKPPCAASP